MNTPLCASLPVVDALSCSYVPFLRVYQVGGARLFPFGRSEHVRMNNDFFDFLPFSYPLYPPLFFILNQLVQVIIPSLSIVFLLMGVIPTHKGVGRSEHGFDLTSFEKPIKKKKKRHTERLANEVKTFTTKFILCTEKTNQYKTSTLTDLYERDRQSIFCLWLRSFHRLKRHCCV